MAAASRLARDASPARRLGWLIGAPLLAVLGVVLVGTPMFEGNDDTGLAMVGAGFGLAVEPDPHLIFAHFGYGVILNALSRIIGPYAHGWATLAAIGLSMALYARALWGRFGTSGYFALAAVCAASSAVFLKPLLEAQFTITSALLFAASFSCWLTTLPEGRRSSSLSIAIVGALILSFLIRPVAAISGFVVVGPALIWQAWRGPAVIRPLMWRFVITVAAITVTAYLTDKAAYAYSPAWRDALEYNQLRSLFNDYYRIPWVAGAPEYQKVGWSANDHAIFMDWYSLHPIFDYANVKFLAESFVRQTPLLVFSGLTGWLATPWEVPLLGALLAMQILLCLLLPRHRAFAMLILLGCLCAIVASALTGRMGRPAQLRVWFAVMSVALLCTLPLLLAADRGFRLSQRAMATVLLATGIFAVATTIHGHRQLLSNAASYRAALSGARQYFSGTVVSWGTALVWEWLITPTTVHAPIAGRTIPSIGLFTKMPITQATLQRLGIADLGSTLCTQPDVRLIASSTVVHEVQRFCQEHYNVIPRATQVFNHSRTAIFVLSPSDRSP